jgi:hypothetical protein
VLVSKVMNDKEQEKQKPICCGGVYCLKLEDKEHSTQFIHLIPVNLSVHTFSFVLFFFSSLN